MNLQTEAMARIAKDTGNGKKKENAQDPLRGNNQAGADVTIHHNASMP
jgi:hypothetical protein